VICLKNYGPEDIPAPLVCYLLQKALASCEVVNEKVARLKTQEEDAQVDCVYSTEGVTINLTLNMSSLWFPVYSFVLAKKEVGEIEIIKSQLKDALEEIQKLRNEARYERYSSMHLCMYFTHIYKYIYTYIYICILCKKKTIS
jgi:hypothetical protein